MKNISAFISFCVAFGSLTLYGQRNTLQSVSPENLTPASLNAQSNYRFKSQQNDQRASYWLDYAIQLNATGGPSAGQAVASFMLLFPDSLIITGQYPNGQTARPRYHKAATIIDPKNMPLVGISPSSPYTLDSIGIGYGYLRNTPSSVVDTLVVQIIRHNPALEYSFSINTTSYRHQDITYNYLSNDITPSQVLATYTYLLTENDSSRNVAQIFMKTATVPAQAAGNRIGAVLSFKPGYSYSATDSLINKNAFYLFTYESNGIGTAPTFYGVANDGTSDLNCSYALPTSVRYNNDVVGGWNGYLMPTWGFIPIYAFENHIIEFKVSELVGIEERTSGLITSAYPNPAHDLFTIDYTLQTDADLTIEVTDLTGRLILAEQLGKKSSGQHRSQLNISDLENGIYTLNLQINKGTIASTKIIVTR